MKNFIHFCGNIKFCRDVPVIAAIGVFDGVHLGHRQIIRQAVARARSMGTKVIALSFSPHPRALISPESMPQLLLTADERQQFLLDAGADMVGFINFTAEVAALAPEEFLLALQAQKDLNITGICVGSCWRFGKGGAGNRAVLEKFCRENNWALDAVPEVEMDGVVISSSVIRQEIAAGNLQRASRMLGRPCSLTGVVEHGFHIATDKLDAPTANLKVHAGVMVPDGVYSGSVEVDGKLYPAALNIGIAPTFGNGLHRVEIHLIGFSGSLYGRTLSVLLHRFLRPERRFDSPEELKKQIVCDVQNIMLDQHFADK